MGAMFTFSYVFDVLRFIGSCEATGHLCDIVKRGKSGKRRERAEKSGKKRKKAGRGGKKWEKVERGGKKYEKAGKSGKKWKKVGRGGKKSTCHEKVPSSQRRSIQVQMSRKSASKSA